MRWRFVLRRVLAAFLLLAFAIGSVLFWNRGEFDYAQLSINLAVAAIGLIWLHIRWREKELRELTPGKVKGIFS